MKNMNLVKFGVQELTDLEKDSISGGADRGKYLWYSGSNSLVYIGYALYNGGVLIYNTGVSIYNWW